MCDPCDSQENGKMEFLFLLLFALTVFIRNENMTSNECKAKTFEIILHAGRVTSLQSWVAKKSCHGQTLMNECYISDYPSPSPTCSCPVRLGFNFILHLAHTTLPTFVAPYVTVLLQSVRFVSRPWCYIIYKLEFGIMSLVRFR